jgi:hypothetical protein
VFFIDKQGHNCDWFFWQDDKIVAAEQRDFPPVGEQPLLMLTTALFIKIKYAEIILTNPRLGATTSQYLPLLHTPSHDQTFLWTYYESHPKGISQQNGPQSK